ncbi:hypothetical protein [Flavobacterium sp. ov086]|uniref:hypothetical protein n=1 Tax=Flavobacterium sp. ov086 TaxID=1761785 RepID=UPI000B69E747|nr:hypothetical protein [Flavobacterium sp. ov086]SNR87850.1 hypothetical protein SAMN04487979_12748 [Flavobacterium sp. ov086]
MRNFALLFLILICLSNCAEFQYSARRQSQTYSVQNCKEIYGKWEEFNKYRGAENEEQEHKPKTWIFNEDGTLLIDNEIRVFKIEDDCSKLIIGSDSNFYRITQTKDVLYLYKMEICLGSRAVSGSISLKK